MSFDMDCFGWRGWQIEARIWRVVDGKVEVLPIAEVAEVLYAVGLIGAKEWIELTPHLEIGKAGEE